MSESITWQVSLSETTLGEEEASAAANVVRSGWLTQGAEVAAFEKEFAVALGHKHAIAISNCTVGLELAYQVLGIGPGDEVIMPALTFVASANAALRVGATPVFVDICSPEDLSIDPNDVERKITPNTKAICAVHYAGFAANMDRLLEISSRRGLAVIEDCAHSPGAKYRGAAVGALGAIGVFSFYGNKNLTTGEGGMMTTQSDSIATQLRLIRAHGMTTNTMDRHKGHAFSYDVSTVGTNGRLDEVRAAIGRVQLGRLLAGNAARAERVRQYRTRLSKIPGLTIPYSNRHDTAPDISSHHLFVVLLPPQTDREMVMTCLRESGVQSSIHYPLITTFTAYASDYQTPPLSKELSGRLLTLPLHPKITATQVDQVCDALCIALHP